MSTSTSPPTSSADEEGSNLPQVQSPFHDSPHSSADEEGSSLHHDHLSTSQTTLTHTTASTVSRWTGFRIVGDNIDCSLRPRHQTMESRTRSFHHFNSYAVLD